MVKVTSLLAKAGSGLKFSFGVRASTEMEIWCVKGMYSLKLVSSEKNSGLNTLHTEIIYTSPINAEIKFISLRSKCQVLLSKC